MKEWCFEKNKGKNPTNILIDSDEVVWWKCSKGHLWEASVKERINGRKCIVCQTKEVITGFNDIKTLAPHLIAEWDYEKNTDLDPEKTACCSNKKAWWKCSKGHSWFSVISSRFYGTGCPYCTNRKVLVGYNDLQTVNPSLSAEWNKKKNGKLTPKNYTANSNQKVWWTCKYGHEWASTMNSRQKKSGCPYCAGLLPIVGVNDLQSTNPELIKEWDYQKNIIKPYEIKVGSGMKIWWKCKEGHSWEATPNHRKKGQGCPYCSGKKVLAGFNDINTLRPNIAKEWDYEKNENKTPDMYTVRSGSKVWWRCKEGHSWKAVIASRTGKKYVQCPYCSGRLPIVGTNDLQTTNPDLIKEWDYEKNSPIYPYMVKKGSNNKIWWKCEKGHEWQAEISARTSGKSGCPYCAGRKTIQGENDLVSIESKLLSEWNYKKNDGKKPSDFKMHSGALVWWKCERGHEWQAKIADRSRGDGCPYCSGKRLMVGFNDLAHVYPYLAKEWNYEKNQGKRPRRWLPECR